jgi:hypothetical protein
MLSVVEGMEISFEDLLPNPAVLLKGLVDGESSDEERIAAIEALWKKVDAVGVRDFRGREVLLCRLGICLLSENENSSSYAENLSWFLEVLGFMGLNVRLAIDLMPQHFNYADKDQDTHN